MALGHPTDQIDKLVIVVHGVGDPAPGETVSEFARSLADGDQPLIEHQETIWLPEKQNEDDIVKRFTSQQRTLRAGNQNIRLADVFWGDLSQVKKGIFGILFGMFQILFGLRYVAYVAADQKIPPARWLQWLGLASSRILHGPVLAIAFFLTILSGAICATQLMWPESYRGVLWTRIVLAGCCLLALAISNVGWNITRSRVVERFWFWVNVTVMFVLGLMIVKTIWIDPAFPDLAFTGAIRPGLIWYCRILIVLLGLLWLAEILVLSAMASSWFLACLHPRVYRPALHVSFLLPALAVGIWGQALPLAWVSAKEGIKQFADMPKFSKAFDEAIPLLGVQFLMMLVISGVAAVIVVRYFLWRRNKGVDVYANGLRSPRLIVHGSLQIVTAVCTCFGMALVLLLGVLQYGDTPYEKFWLGRFMAQANYYAIMLIVPIGGFVALLLPYLRGGFDILLDVVNHFYFRATQMADALDDDDEFDINETTFESGSLFFSRRDAIHHRFKRILAHYRDALENRPELVIVSHSQGTMIAIESLNDPEMVWLGNRFSKITLVTMGSPFTHVYQHYFRHLYPGIEDPFWSELRSRVDRWTNIFRIDDYVGTDIDFPDSESEGVASDDFSNHPIAPRGHTYYFSDRDVLNLIKSECLACQKEGGQDATPRMVA